ncbi:MAG: T9SS type A sorting domain-containing protein [Ferruginibacter sp.]
MKRISLLLSATIAVFFVNAQDVLLATGNTNITVDKNANMYVGGGISLENKSSIHNDGTILIARANTGRADLLDNTNATYNYGAGSFIFWGNGTQSVRTNAKFGTLEVDNNGLNLLSDISSDKWNLKSGVVNTGSYYAIAAASQSSWFSSDADNNGFSKSWINGNLRQYISTAHVNNYVFPVGDASRVRVCEMDNLSKNPLTGVQYVNVSFARPQGWNVNATENEMKYKAVNAAGMWTIIPDAKPVSGSYDLKLSVSDFPGLWDNRFGVLNRTATDWTVPAGSSLPADGSIGRTVSGGFAIRNNVKVFNQFAVASMDIMPADLSASYKVYPDPVTNNEFFIQVKNYQLNGFKMFAADGKEVSVSSVVRKDGQVQVKLPVIFTKGTYIVQLNTDKGLKTAKIIVQ